MEGMGLIFTVGPMPITYSTHKYSKQSYWKVYLPPVVILKISVSQNTNRDNSVSFPKSGHIL